MATTQKLHHQNKLLFRWACHGLPGQPWGSKVKLPIFGFEFPRGKHTANHNRPWTQRKWLATVEPNHNVKQQNMYIHLTLLFQWQRPKNFITKTNFCSAELVMVFLANPGGLRWNCLSLDLNFPGEKHTANHNRPWIFMWDPWATQKQGYS